MSQPAFRLLTSSLEDLSRSLGSIGKGKGDDFVITREFDIV